MIKERQSPTIQSLAIKLLSISILSIQWMQSKLKIYKQQINYLLHIIQS